METNNALQVFSNGELGDFRPTYGRFRVKNWEIEPYVNSLVY